MDGKVEVRIGSINDMREDVNRIFDNPQAAEREVAHRVYVSIEDLPKVLSGERVRLIHEIRRRQYTIGELASKLHRKRENISRDLSLLQRYGIVEMRKSGRERHPTAGSKITITI